MNSEQENAQKVVADFLVEMADATKKGMGWWYRLPKLNDNKVYPEDEVMPSIGKLFGFDDDEDTVALLAVLNFVKLEYPSNGRKASRSINKKGIEAFANTYKVNDMFQVTPTRLNNNRGHYLRIGKVAPEYDKPASILKLWRDNPREISCPTKLCPRRMEAFLKNQLACILRNSSTYRTFLFNMDDEDASSDEEDQEEERRGPLTDAVTAIVESIQQPQQAEPQDAQEVPDAESNPAEWKIGNGKTADSSKYPAFAALRIPEDNEQTHKVLVSELAKAQKSTPGALPTSKIPGLKDINGNFYVKIPKGNGEKAKKSFAKTVMEAAKYSAGQLDDPPSSSSPSDEPPAADEHITALLDKIATDHPELFNNVAKKHGLSTKDSSIMSAVDWLAMANAANLNFTQQREIIAHLKAHFGYRITVSEKELSKIGSEYIPFKQEIREFQFDGEKNKSKIRYFWKDASEVFKHHSKLFFQHRDEIKHLELLFGGDHGQGAFSFLMVVIVRYSTDREDDKYELQLGEIDSTKDCVEILEPLLQMLEPGIKALQMNKEGFAFASVDHESGDIEFEKKSSQGAFKMRCWLMGDLKFLFMVVGRTGFEGAHCLYCTLRKAQWLKCHKEELKRKGNGKAVTMDFMKKAWLASSSSGQPDLEEGAAGEDDEEFKEFAQKSPPLWDMFPVAMILFPFLHIVLGLGNLVFFESFFRWVDERIEALPEALLKDRREALLAEIKFETVEDEIKQLTARHDELNALLVVCRAEKKTLVKGSAEHDQWKAEKAELEEEKKAKFQARAQLRKVLKKLRSKKTELKAKEAATRKTYKLGDRSVRELVFQKLAPRGVQPSSYHGGDMEGPPMRTLMADATIIFDEIKEVLVSAVAGRDGNIASPEEISTYCEDYARLFGLLDAVLKLVNTPHGQVTPDTAEELDKALEKLLNEWVRLEINFPPKFHLLLDHAVGFVTRTEGMADMGEDDIERMHQARLRIHNRLNRLRNVTMMKEAQAKAEQMALLPEVRNQEKQVAETRKRNFLGETKTQKKKAAKVAATAAKRQGYIDQPIDPNATKHKKARELVKDQMKEASGDNMELD